MKPGKMDSCQVIQEKAVTECEKVKQPVLRRNGRAERTAQLFAKTSTYQNIDLYYESQSKNHPGQKRPSR